MIVIDSQGESFDQSTIIDYHASYQTVHDSAQQFMIVGQKSQGQSHPLTPHLTCNLFMMSKQLVG